jgi:hypothetical protein
MSIKDFFGNILSKVRNYGFLRRCRELREEFNEAYVLAQQRKFEREFESRRARESEEIIAAKRAADNK